MRYATRTAEEFARAYKEGVRVDEFGRVRLAGKNLLPDPRLKEFDPGGQLVHWREPTAPPSSNGRSVYGGRVGERQTRQNDGLMARRVGAYTQVLALQTGATLPTGKGRDDMPQAGALRLYVVPASAAAGSAGGATGYPAGAYFRSYAWVVGDLRDPRRMFLTEPAPPVAMTLAEGQSYEQPLPREAPDLVPGLALLQSKPGGPNNQLYIQKIIRVNDFMPEKEVMDGALVTDLLAPTKNQTFIGGFDRWPAPATRKGAGWAELEVMDTAISYRLKTKFGLSASQGYKRVVAPLGYRHTKYDSEGNPTVVAEYSARNTFMYFVFPTLHPLVTHIIPQIQAPDGQWQDIDYGLPGGMIPVSGFNAYFTTDDSQKINTGLTYRGGERSLVDETGVKGPDSPLAEARVYGSARIGPGSYTFRGTDAYDVPGALEVAESEPGPPSTVTLGSNQAVIVDFLEEAEEGNVTPNGDYEALEPTGAVRRWKIPASTANVSASENVVRFNDTSGGATDQDVFLSDPFDILAASPYTARAGINITRYASGVAVVQLRFLDANNAVLANRGVMGVGVAGLNVVELTCGPAGSGATFIWPAGTRRAQWVFRLSGSTANGARDLTGRFVHVGLFRGLTAPCKHDAPDPVPFLEPEDVPYPGGSYISVIESPN